MLAWLLSNNRKAINLRIVGMAFVVQFSIAIFALYLDFGKVVIQKISNGAQHVIDFSQEGISFVYGPLANEWSFAINALPTPKGKPCPNEPVENSTPGTLWLI